MISKKCKYAIKAILHVARSHKENEGSSSAQIADDEQIPKKFLEAILLELRNAGILKSKRGKEGGYTLQKAPNQISMAEIIRIIDGPIAMLPCVSLNYYSACEECDESTCQIKKTFQKVRDLTLEVLTQSTAEKLT